MKGFAYFSGWIIEGRQGILKELEGEFRSYDKLLALERKKVSQLEAELGSLRSSNGPGCNGNLIGGGPSPGGGAADKSGEGGGRSSAEGRGNDVDVVTQPGRDRIDGSGGRDQGEGSEPGPSTSVSGSGSTGSGVQVKPVHHHPPEEVLGGFESSSSTTSSTDLSRVPLQVPHGIGRRGGRTKVPEMKRKRGRPPIYDQCRTEWNAAMASSSVGVPPVTSITPTIQSESPSKKRTPETTKIAWSPEIAVGFMTPAEAVTQSSLANCDAAVQRRSVDHLTSVPIPPGSQEGLLRLISNLVKGQRVERNCPQLSHSMRLLESLLFNPTMDVDKHATAIQDIIFDLYVGCRASSPEWWDLLDLAASLLGKLGQISGSVRKSLKQLLGYRLGQVLDIANGRGLPLLALYNSIVTVKEMGTEYVRSLVLPNIRKIGERLFLAEVSINTSEFSEIDRVCMIKIQGLIVRIASPILESIWRTLPDPVTGYEAEFGNYFAGKLHHRVQLLRIKNQER